jgi:hypothetical protein
VHCLLRQAAPAAEEGLTIDGSILFQYSSQGELVIPVEYT